MLSQRRLRGAGTLKRKGGVVTQSGDLWGNGGRRKLEADRNRLYGLMQETDHPAYINVKGNQASEKTTKLWGQRKRS